MLPLVRDGFSTRRAGVRGPAVLGEARYLASAFLWGRRVEGCGAESVFDLAGEGAAARTVEADPMAGRAAHWRRLSTMRMV